MNAQPHGEKWEEVANTTKTKDKVAPEQQISPDFAINMFYIW